MLQLAEIEQNLRQAVAELDAINAGSVSYCEIDVTDACDRLNEARGHIYALPETHEASRLRALAALADAHVTVELGAPAHVRAGMIELARVYWPERMAVIAGAGGAVERVAA